MTTYRPRLTSQESFDLAICVNEAIESALTDIDKAASLAEAEYHEAKIERFCALYVKLRALAGYTAAGEHRANAWRSRMHAGIARKAPAAAE